jgi:hypothetical protein
MLRNENQKTMDNWMVILISVGMILLFIGPFVVLSSVKGRRRVHRKFTGKKKQIAG